MTSTIFAITNGSFANEGEVYGLNAAEPAHT